jgi:hypothetical protein
VDNEIPIGKRTRLYRFFERLPAMASYGAIIVLIVLSIVNPVLAAVYLLAIILTMFVKANDCYPAPFVEKFWQKRQQLTHQF